MVSAGSKKIRKADSDSEEFFDEEEEDSFSEPSEQLDPSESSSDKLRQKAATKSAAKNSQKDTKIS